MNTKTYLPKKEDIKKVWYIVDASDKILGRLATKVAVVLRGKHKAIFTPNMDTGDGVIVINAAKIKVTGRKMTQKVYRRYSGYPGGKREVTLENMLAKRPETVIRLAVQRMLPQGPLGRDLVKKLKVYADDKHGQQAQKPIVLEV
ncbi:MAG TPA: 50S ribosomal protein L13 [Candidatus Omnitrophota bacterium]|nr:50S ribosomal protein L13 [Candidatus Omnitrophota bacterium]HPT06562.1 50S ribosomal protein L13 [Candidatus Omnitrophota bacterium]